MATASDSHRGASRASQVARFPAALFWALASTPSTDFHADCDVELDSGSASSSLLSSLAANANNLHCLWRHKSCCSNLPCRRYSHSSSHLPPHHQHNAGPPCYANRSMLNLRGEIAIDWLLVPSEDICTRSDSTLIQLGTVALVLDRLTSSIRGRYLLYNTASRSDRISNLFTQSS